MTLEQLLVVAIFVLAPLLNYLVRVLRRHLPAPAPGGPAPAPAPPPVDVRPLSWPLEEERPAAPRRPPAPRPARRPAALGPVRRPTAWMASPRQVRRGIVLMAVLGTCRGLEPPPSGRPGEPPPARPSPPA